MSIQPIAMGVIEESATLEDCEHVYQQAERNAAIIKGAVLQHVRDHRLYQQAQFASFEEYAEKRIGIQRAHAYRLIDLASTAAALSPIGDIPPITNEGQARAIKPVLRDHGPEVAAEVLREAAGDDGRITARSISEAASRVIEPEIVDAEVIDDEPPVLTSQQWMAREGYDLPDDPDPDDLLPAQSKFERAFWRHIASGHELAKDFDYPQHFTEQMISSAQDLIAILSRKQEAVTNRQLRVVNGGK